MINKTMDSINTLLNSFHDNWHLPTLQLVNAAWRERTPSALLDAVKQTEQAITALERLQTVVARLVERDGTTITADQAWHTSNSLEELACSLQYITVELGELAMSIAEEHVACESE